MRIDSTLVYLAAAVLFHSQDLTNAAFDNCKPYTVIPEANYDKDPSSIRDTTKHPNGFSYGLASYPPTSTNLQNPCVFLTNLTDRAVEVMAQTFLSGNKICVRNDGGNAECRETISKCWAAHADTVKYEFYCDPGKGCDSEVQFWYRLVPSTGAKDIDNWCTLIRSGNDFPKNLLPRPSEIPTKETTTSCGSVVILSVLELVNVLGALLICFYS